VIEKKTKTVTRQGLALDSLKHNLSKGLIEFHATDVYSNFGVTTVKHTPSEVDCPKTKVMIMIIIKGKLSLCTP
jgi:hypothetical protein